MKSSEPIHTDIVLIGGGHSHVAVLKSFGMRPEPGVRLTLIARDVMTPYSGMLPGLIAGHYTHAEAHVDLQRLCRFAGARLIHAPANGIDLNESVVHCDGRLPVGFDVLSLDIGITPDVSSIDGASTHARTVKPVDAFLAEWTEVEAACIEHQGDLDIVCIGAGAGGVELTLSVDYRLKQLTKAQGLASSPRLHIVSRTPDILPSHAASVRARLNNALHRAGITIVTEARAIALDATSVTIDGPGGTRQMPAELCFAVVNAGAPGWLRDTGLALDAGGFIRVGPTLTSVSDPRVFAAGDIASFDEKALPKSGVYAVRQGPVLAKNLRRVARGGAPVRYRPQPRTLALISTGERHAVASYGSLSFEGEALWRLKDWIDRRWMAKYQDLPAMDEADAASSSRPRSGQTSTPEAFAMRCGGCGSKVASPILRRVLEQFPTGAHPDVLVGLAHSDDAAVIDIPAGQLLVQSVDHFRTFIDDPYVFARVTTNHCLSDLFAMGASAHTAQAMVSLPFADERKIEQDLLALMTGMREALDDAGAVLVGGHTAEGPEMSLGLSVNGLISPDAMMTKGGAQAGDILILTKPLGTGVIFAADMRADASAHSVQFALDSMLLSNRRAAECLASFGARGCTDVTGFGLAGHLIEMLRAGAVNATLELSALPLLPGAATLFERGFRSSLDAGNAAFSERIDGAVGTDAERAALFDPQTSGGLIASVQPKDVEPCLAALHRAGFLAAAAVGEIHAVALPDLPNAGRIELQ